MAWEQLSINKPHLVYIILGGFTSIFMLCSSVIKERLYIGEATVATLCGIIFGPHAADLINPNSWGNVDQITLEFSRIVLVVQCFAVGVELPKAYMERHWRSVTMLLVPVMTFGWLITSLFIWWLFGGHLNWLDSLCVAACVTATDPVLASSVVGKGKFARRVPRHLRDLLSAESGCNDGMAFPFIYLALYIIRYRPDASKVSFHWFCYTILYECIFGAFYGVCVGYIARRAIRYAHEKDLIDRESFLVFYFVLALFCAGSGSLLGMDDLLIGFACGVGFSNDGWFQEKTEESHVSNVIDLLINLAFFVYFGTIIPWEQYNSNIIGTSPWRLVVLGIFVVLFRRIPIMVVMKPLIPDIKTWREALFAGHFGPIGVGAIFVAILARAELETEETTPLAQLPEAGFEHLNIIELIWPITTFLVIISIVVHGSSIAVFTLGKHINTLTLTLSYTQANEDGPGWMDRLPRIQSRSKSSMSLPRRPDETDSSLEEKMQELGMDPNQMSPSGLPKNFLRRVRDEEEGRGSNSRSSSMKPFRRKKKWDDGIGPGGRVDPSAIAPVSKNRDHVDQPDNEKAEISTESETLALNESDESHEKRGEKAKVEEPEEEVYDEGDHTIIEDEDGNVLEVLDTKGESKKEKEEHIKHEGQDMMEEKDVEHGISQTEEKNPLKRSQTNPRSQWYKAKNMMQSYRGMSRPEDAQPGPSKAESGRKRGPALAYQYGNTIIVEDEDGEVLKKYDIPQTGKPQRPGQGDRKASFVDERTRQRMNRIGSMLGFHSAAGGEDTAVAGSSAEGAAAAAGAPSAGAQGVGKAGTDESHDDDRIRFTINAGGRRMSKAEFIQQIQKLDPKSRANFVEDSDVSEPIKEEARKDARDQQASRAKLAQRPEEAVSPVEEEETTSDDNSDYIGNMRGRSDSSKRPQVQRLDTSDSAAGQHNLAFVDSNEHAVPMHSVNDDLARFSFGQETAAMRRRRNLERQAQSRTRNDQDYDGIERSTGGYASGQHHSNLEEEETAAERRRRLGALGQGAGADDNSESSEDEGPGRSGLREPPAARTRDAGDDEQGQGAARPGIRFADTARPTGAGGNGREIRRPRPASSNHNSGSSDARQGNEGGASSSGGGIAGRLRWGANIGRDKKK